MERNEAKRNDTVQPNPQHVGCPQAFSLSYLLSLFLFKSTYFKISSLQRMGGLSAIGVQRGKICVD